MLSVGQMSLKKEGGSEQSPPLTMGHSSASFDCMLLVLNVVWRTQLEVQNDN